MVIKIYTPLKTKKNRYDSLWKPNGFCYENHNHWLTCSAPNRPWLPPLDSVASHPPFLTTTFFVPSGHETWWKMAMMLDPFSSIFTQYMGFCPGICHICPRIWRYNGHRMGFKKKLRFFVCLRMEVSRYPPIWQFQCENDDKPVTFRGAHSQTKPKSNMISACFSKSPELANCMNEKSWFYPLVNIQKSYWKWP